VEGIFVPEGAKERGGTKGVNIMWLNGGGKKTAIYSVEHTGGEEKRLIGGQFKETEKKMSM